jgi:uncharacterized protein YjbI with pentapeptide repeats
MAAEIAENPQSLENGSSQGFGGFMKTLLQFGLLLVACLASANAGDFQYDVHTNSCRDFGGSKGLNTCGPERLGSQMQCCQMAFTFVRRDLPAADYSGSSFNMPDFTDARMDGSNFTATTLKGAHFDHSQLNGCNFYRADLRGAVFDGNVQAQGAMFMQADLRGAVVRSGYFVNSTFAGADLRGADVSGIYAADQFSGAIYDSKTVLPFSRAYAEQHGMICKDPSGDCTYR